MQLFRIVVALLILSACTNRSFTPVVPEALSIGTPHTVFVATTRTKKPDGSYGYGRSERLQRLEVTVSIPPTHTPGELRYAYAKPDPRSEFTLAARSEFATPAAFRARIGQALDQLPADEREVSVFIHGYNATQAETAFRAAQLANDINLPGALVIYSWPSQGKVLGYAYDIDSALFARNGLKQLLFELKGAGTDRIVLVAHSMGALVLMEALREIDLQNPGWAGRNISGVLLISPDLDVQLFRLQMASLAVVPRPFVMFVSGKDRILNISANLRGRSSNERLGNIRDLDQIADLPVSVFDTTAFSKDAESPHFVAGSSPALIALLNKRQSLNETFGPDQRALDFLIPGDFLHQNNATRITLMPTPDSQR